MKKKNERKRRIRVNGELVERPLTEEEIQKRAKEVIRRRDTLVRKMPALSLSDKVALMESGFLNSRSDGEICDALKIDEYKLANLRRINEENAKRFKDRVVDAKSTALRVAHQRLIYIQMLQEAQFQDPPDDDTIMRCKDMLRMIDKYAPTTKVLDLSKIVKDLGDDGKTEHQSTIVNVAVSPGVAEAEKEFRRLQSIDVTPELVEPEPEPVQLENPVADSVVERAIETVESMGDPIPQDPEPEAVPDPPIIQGGEDGQ